MIRLKALIRALFAFWGLVYLRDMESLIASVLVPPWYAALVCFVLGAVLGSFTQVFVYRFNTGASINTPSHCLACGRRIRWYELVPVLSYTLLRGRCRSCSAKIPMQDFLVETGFGLLIFSLLWLTTSWVTFGFLVVVLALLLAISLYDLAHYIIPDALLVLLAGVFLIESVFARVSIEKIVFHCVAIAGSFLFFFLLWYISEGRWLGFGDAKLAAVLAIPLTPFFALSMVVFSFWIGTIVMLAIIAASYARFAYTTRHLDKKHKSFTIEHKVPFAPFLVLSFIVVYVFHFNLADFLVYVV
jgi:leader peptidase (prepilin peptidase) / N-methyltransferase